MKKRDILIIVAFALISSVLIAAAPMATDLISLTIENNTNDYVTYRLEGPQFYYLMVPPHFDNTFTIERGDYTEQKFYSCGTFVNTTFDVNKKQSINVPKCGDKLFKTNKASNSVIDGGKIIKLVKVTFENPYTYDLMIILRGPATHVFYIEAGNDESYTITKGEYKVTQYGCSYLKLWNFYPHANKVKELSCPTY